MAIMEPIKTLKPGTKAERTFQLDRAAFNAESRTVELSFSSETPYERWWGTEILDHTKKSIRLDRLKSGGPLLVDHDTTDIVGVIESVRVDSDLIGRAVVRFGKSVRAEEVFQDVQDGIRRNVSVGYMIHEAQLVETKDGVDTYRVTDWEPLEISLVSVPADATVGVGRSAEESPVITENPIQIKEQETMSETTISAADVAAAETRGREDAQKSEQKRASDILTMGDDYGHPALASKAVRDGISVQEFQTVLLNARKSKGGTADYGQGGRTKENLQDDKKHGFRNLGHFCHDVMQATAKRNISETLSRAASTFANESAGPDGGYQVPPEFSMAIASIGLAEDSLLSRCDNMTISGNTMTYAKDESTPWGTTGVTAAWEGEGNQSTPTKPIVGEASLKLKKLKVLVAATEELLSDASGMSSYITRKMGEAVGWKEQDAIINGTGSGMPMGITKSGVIVTQTKESGQSADTIVAANIAKMYARVIQGAGSNLVWLINPDAFPQVVTMTLGNNVIWMAPNSGAKDAPNGSLLGRPIVLTDACQTLGDKFDIILGNMSGYRAITKAGGSDLQTSMHLWFDQDLMAFRLIFRMDGQTTFSAPITPPNSAVTRSHFVCLEAR